VPVSAVVLIVFKASWAWLLSQTALFIGIGVDRAARDQ